MTRPGHPHPYLTPAQCQELADLITAAAKQLDLHDGRRLNDLFAQYATDLKKARATAAGLQQQVSVLRAKRRAEAEDTP